MVNDEAEKIKEKLRAAGYAPWYSDDYWCKSGDEYNGRRPAELYAELLEVPTPEKFDVVMQAELALHSGARLYIWRSYATPKGCTTYHTRDELKKKFNAKWDQDRGAWYVADRYILSKEFHEYCYRKDRHYKFTWD